MDILVRNIPPDIIKIIEQKAKKANVSRQTYILTQLCRMAQMDSFVQERNEYASLVKKLGRIIEYNTSELSALIEKIDDIKK